jgi:hypothetical protein
MVFLIYGAAAALALLLLYFFHANWYWHALSVAAALAIGVLPPDAVPLPAAWGVTRDMIVGCIFVFLMAWGLCAPLFRRHHLTPHATSH